MTDLIDERMELLIERVADLDNELSKRIYLQGALKTNIDSDTRQEIVNLIATLPDPVAKARIKELMRPGVQL